MNYTMITNHAHACMNPPPFPPKEPESKKIGFVAPIFASSEISKTIMYMLSKHGTTNVKQDKNEMV